ncbi:MAG TPA: hypothetical protein VFI22_00715, partial [Thermomicrobiales bacterium]|nr:hypothetical protein [Thermomicrobiales bacterium]
DLVIGRSSARLANLGAASAAPGVFRAGRRWRAMLKYRSTPERRDPSTSLRMMGPAPAHAG